MSRISDKAIQAGIVTVTCLVAFLLLALSFQFERAAYSTLFSAFALASVPLPTLIAATFNGTKILLAWFLAQQSGDAVERWRWWAMGASWVLLVLLSLLCTAMVVSQQVDDPRLADALDAKRDQVERTYSGRINALSREHSRQEQILKEHIEERMRAVTATREEHINDLRRYLDEERQNVVNGRFIGPNYRGLQVQLAEAKTRFERQVDRIVQQERKQRKSLRQAQQEEMNGLRAERERELAAITPDTLRGSAEAAHPMIQAFVDVTGRSFGTQLKPTRVALVLSAIISLIIELAPLALIGALARIYTLNQTNKARREGMIQALPTRSNQAFCSQTSRSWST